MAKEKYILIDTIIDANANTSFGFIPVSLIDILEPILHLISTLLEIILLA